MIQPQTCSRWMTGLGSLFLLASPVGAGVVFEIQTTDHEASPPRTETTEVSAEGKNLKMEVAAGLDGGNGDMIYRGDRREMVVVDHEDKSYTVIDEAAIRQIAGQVSGAIAQVQEALKDVPADQRAMIEEMMKKRMPEAAAPQRPVTELRKTGERGTRAGYPCVRYDILVNGRKKQELWVTDWGNIEGGADMVDAFEDMADFFREMMAAMPDFGQGDSGIGDGAFEYIKELGGFPVVTREFDDYGALEDESTLRSSRRRTLDPEDFEPPAGYKRQQMFPQ